MDALTVAAAAAKTVKILRDMVGPGTQWQQPLGCAAHMICCMGWEEV